MQTKNKGEKEGGNTMGKQKTKGKKEGEHTVGNAAKNRRRRTRKGKQTGQQAEGIRPPRKLRRKNGVSVSVYCRIEIR